MTGFTANISTLFNEFPLIERFSQAALAGFKKIEIQFPYELNKEDIAAQLESHQLNLVLINLPKGANGELGVACDPQRIPEFQDAVQKCAQYATFLNVKRVNCLTGIAPSHIDPATAKATLINNLIYAANLFKKLNIRLLIEAINTIDIPGFYLHNSKQAIDIIDQVNCSHLKFQYDVYHMQIMEGNLITRMREILSYIDHIQIADVPGRAEPGSGEINYPNLLNAINLMGYTGEISLEYFPRQSTISGLNKIKPLLLLKGD